MLMEAMASQPADPLAGRQPVRDADPLEPLGPTAIRIGLRTTLLVPLAAAASVALLADDGPGLGSLLVPFLALVVGGGVVAFLPWDRLHGTATGGSIIHGWAALNVVLTALAGWSAGGAEGVLQLAYALTIVFFAVTLSPRVQLAYPAFLLACDALMLFSSRFDPVPLAMLWVLGVLASFLSREVRRRLASHERARVEAERRWSVVGSVSKVARDVSASEPRRVLQGVVHAIATLGYDAAIHVPGASGGLELILPDDVSADPTRGIRTLPEAVQTEVLGGGRDILLPAKAFDRQVSRTLRSSGIETIAAMPILVGDRAEAVLLVGSNGKGSIGAT